MSVAKEIAPHLPYLRRFARTLCGTQPGGDAYVIATLEAIVADPGAFPRDLAPRIALYQTFLRLWSSVPLNATSPAAGVVDINLDALTPRPRQAFLLSTVEGFRTDEVATVMQVGADAVGDLINVASREIAVQVATKVMIIEDEPIIAMDIEALVEDLGHKVTGIARTHAEAIAEIGRGRPGLILADIQLADGSSGLDAVNEILQSVNVPVIFITAFPERLLTGERPEPAFLIAKPFDPAAVKAAISQALFFDRKAGGKAA